MNPSRTHEYLLRSRERIFDAVRSLDEARYRTTFPFGLKSIAATLTHLFTSEWYYIERILGADVPPYDTWPVKEETPPAFGELETLWHAQGERVHRVITAERDWARPISWLGFPDEHGRRFTIKTTAGDLMTQLALHEMHHRAQAMVMLRSLGHPVEDIDFNAMMFERVPQDA